MIIPTVDNWPSEKQGAQVVEMPHWLPLQFLAVAADFVSGILMPVWYALFLAARDADAIAFFAGAVPVLLATVVVWQLGMTVHLLRRVRAS